MMVKDVAKYAEDNWGSYLAPITEISHSGNARGPLVISEKAIYNFDAICQAIFPSGQTSDLL